MVAGALMRNPKPKEKSMQNIVERLKPHVNWNNFAMSLCEQAARGRTLSTRQVEAAERMLAKLDARQAERAAAEQSTVAVNLSPIKEKFDDVHAKGNKRPRFYANGIVISRAPDHGRNAGALYVKYENGEYCGKVVNGRFMPVKVDENITRILQDVALDPMGTALRHGKLTGSCSCCGRPLTDPTSIEKGIGPICEARWFPA